MQLTSLFPSEAIPLLTASGMQIVKQIGMDTLRTVVLDIMSGRNLRDSTESITRRRIAALNLAIVEFFLQGNAQTPDFVSQLPYLATENLQQGKLSKVERWLNLWALGLTDKGFQNILRDKTEGLAPYRDEYIATCRNIIDEYEEEHGAISGTLTMTSKLHADVSWNLLLAMMNMAGSQTLAVRGSDKSLNGKLFEKLILGSLLHVLGFTHVSPENSGKAEGVYWLSSTDAHRESDATLLLYPGRAVRFDIGFIGWGNSEISLDKVTRFEREIALNGNHYYLSTIIIVDRIGEKSRLESMAKRVNGDIIQMSAGYWIQAIARILHDRFGFNHPLVQMKQGSIKKHLQSRLASAPFEVFLGLSQE